MRQLQEERTTKRSSRFTLLARWLVGIVLLLIVISSVDWQQMKTLLHEIRWWLALPIVVAISATNIFVAWAWQLLIACFSSTWLSLWEASKLYFIAQAIGSVTPMNLGSDLYRVHAITSRQGGLREALAAIIVQRLTSMQAIALLGCIATFVIPLPARIIHSVAIATGVLLSGSILAVWIASLRRWLLWKAGLGSIPFAQLRKAIFIGLLFALIFHGSGTMLGSLLVNIVGVGIPFPTAWAILIMARLTILLPFTVNGLGFMEGALVFLFTQFGIASEASLMVALLLRLPNLITIALGAIFFWSNRK